MWWMVLLLWKSVEGVVVVGLKLALLKCLAGGVPGSDFGGLFFFGTTFDLFFLKRFLILLVSVCREFCAKQHLTIKAFEIPGFELCGRI